MALRVEDEQSPLRFRTGLEELARDFDILSY